MKNHRVTTFTLEVSTENAAFDDDPGAELARILRTVAKSLHEGGESGTVRDVNGNTVGRWEAS